MRVIRELRFVLGSPDFCTPPNSASLFDTMERDFGDPAEQGMDKGDGISLLALT